MTGSYRSLFYLLIFIVATFLQSGTPKEKEKGMKKEVARWAVQKSSTLHIKGSSNVNNFGCDITGYYQPDTITCFQDSQSDKPIPLKGSLEIDVLSFDCHNRILTSDLRKTLKSNEYPKLIIRFLSLERNPIIKNNKDVLKGTVLIELAGSSKCFDMCYSFEKSDISFFKLNGNQTFSFADFKLAPPSKFGGLVKVKDKFVVDFNLLLQPVD
jgi:hypothetical protein